MKKILLVISFIILIFIGTTLIVSFKIINGNNYLRKFNIISVNNVSTKFNIRFEKVKAASKYELIIYNQDDSIFYQKETNDNDLNITLNDIENNHEYKLVVYAYNDEGESIIVNNPYIFTYLEPTFSKNNEIVFNDGEDYYLLIDGNLSKKNYFIEIVKGNEIISKKIIKDNDYLIKKDIFTGKKGIFIINLYDQNILINTIKIYSNLSPITDIKINSPLNDELLTLEDINISYVGGENATSYALTIYKDKSLIKKVSINKNNVILSSAFFEKGEKYTIKVIGYYNDIDEYTKKDEVTFTIKNKDTLKPAYYLYSNGRITLKNPNEIGEIYYSINGENPMDNVLESKEPFKVSNNTVIKTIIKDDKKKYDFSKIVEYNINIRKKDNYKIYLFLDDNDKNRDILDNIKKYLKIELDAYNIDIIINDNNNIKSSINKAKTENIDLYLSLKSSESISHESNGFNIWINNYDSISYSLGNIFLNNLKDAYYESASKGLKYAYNSLEELNQNYPSLLINLGYLDNSKDSNFLCNNADKIGKVIAKTILEYFDLF